MKTYSGAPGADGNNIVSVAEDGAVRFLPGGPYGWGKDLRRAALGKALLTEHLGDEYQAAKYYGRFVWRVLVNFQQEAPWQLSGSEIDAALADIKSTEQETARARSTIANERPPVENEGGISVVDSKPLPPITVDGVVRS